jgi:hypothetical protein
MAYVNYYVIVVEAFEVIFASRPVTLRHILAFLMRLFSQRTFALGLHLWTFPEGFNIRQLA